MPRYEYRCDANAEVVEVSHAMTERLATWGEVCERAARPLGDTPASAPVEKVISVGLIASGKPSADAGRGPCGPGCGCHPH